MIQWFRACTLLLVVAVVWGVLSALAGVPRVQFVNPPAYVPEQSMVTYYVRTPKHDDNRALIVEAFDPSFPDPVRRSAFELHGDRSQAMWNINWRLPVGELVLVATVEDTQRQVWRDVRRVTVYATGP